MEKLNFNFNWTYNFNTTISRGYGNITKYYKTMFVKFRITNIFLNHIFFSNYYFIFLFLPTKVKKKNLFFVLGIVPFSSVSFHLHHEIHLIDISFRKITIFKISQLITINAN